MSDYVGALLRSAGVVMAAGDRARVTPGFAADELTEQTVAQPAELPVTQRSEASPIGARDQPASRQGPVPAAQASSLPPSRPEVEPAAPSVLRRDAAPARHLDASAPPSARVPSTGPSNAIALHAANDLPLHPMVQAALKWVSAEPAAAATARPPAAPSSVSGLSASAPPVAPPGVTMVERTPQSAARPASRASMTVSPPPQRETAGEPPPSSPSRRAPAGRAAVAAAAPPEIHIGAIHLIVDAPRPLAPPPAPAPRPTAAPAAPRSGFLRSRAPRV